MNDLLDFVIHTGAMFFAFFIFVGLAVLVVNALVRE
jgi:hypothetical protein